MAMRAVWKGPIAYDAHNVEADMKAAVLEGDKGAEELITLARNNEAQCIADSQWIVACSDQDIQRFDELYGGHSCPSVVAGNGIDLSTTPYVDHEQRRQARAKLGLSPDQETLVFMGSWHGPNIEAGHRILDLARTRPGQQFWLFGSLCNHPDFKKLPDNVKSLGLLSEKQKQVVMSSASIALNPMTSGSGTNLKMLDYGACGLDIISTPFGNRGLDLKDREELTLSPLDRFGDAIDQVTDRALDERERMTQQARSSIEERFDWPACAEKMISLIKEHGY